jgi:hypothetical protein
MLVCNYYFILNRFKVISFVMNVTIILQYCLGQNFVNII